MELAIKEKVFSFDVVEELVESFRDESEQEAAAVVTFNDEGLITLTICEFEECEVTVFRTKETQELYDLMDAKYLEILEDSSSGNDFWDQWNALLDALEPFKIVDEVLNP